MELLLHTCTISEYRDTDVTGHMAMTEVATDVPCLVVPMSAAAAVQNQLTAGRAYDVFFDPDTDIKVGQRISWKGRELYVGGVQPYEEFPDVAHKRAACQEKI